MEFCKTRTSKARYPNDGKSHKFCTLPVLKTKNNRNITKSRSIHVQSLQCTVGTMTTFCGIKSQERARSFKFSKNTQSEIASGNKNIALAKHTIFGSIEKITLGKH